MICDTSTGRHVSRVNCQQRKQFHYLSPFSCVSWIEHHNLQLFISKSLIHHLIIEKTLKNIISRAFPSQLIISNGVHSVSPLITKATTFLMQTCNTHAHVLDSGDNCASGMLFLINICLFLLNFLILRWRYLICREIFLLFFWYYIKKSSGKERYFWDCENEWIQIKSMVKCVWNGSR